METLMRPDGPERPPRRDSGPADGAQRAQLDVAGQWLFLMQCAIAAAGTLAAQLWLVLPGLTLGVRIGGSVTVTVVMLIALAVSAQRGTRNTAAVYRAAVISLEQQLHDLSYRHSMDAVLDPTGVYTYAHFLTQFKQELNQAQRARRTLSLVLVDIVGFRIINEHYGHAAADGILRRFARTVLRASVRSSDLVARYGGDQFLVLLQEADQALAQVVVRRIVERAEEGIPMSGQGTLPLRVAYGLASFPKDAQTDEELFQKAEAALRAAKVHALR